MNDAASTQFQDFAPSGASRVRGRRWAAPWGLLRRLTSPSRPASDAPADTAAAPVDHHAPVPSRGQALREAHRTLQQRLRSHPALRQVLPHLAHIERKLGKHGSRALLLLPLPVLQRGLAQLAMLQRDDEAPADAANLRVMRLRLIEAIALRSPSADARVQPRAFANPARPTGGDGSTLAGPATVAGRAARQGLSRLPAPEVVELSASRFDDVLVDWGDEPGDAPVSAH